MSTFGENAPPVCLFRENPNRLVTLWEVLNRYKCMGICVLCSETSRCGTRLKSTVDSGHRATDVSSDEREEIISIISAAITVAVDLNLRTLWLNANRLQSTFRSKNPLSVELALHGLSDLRADAIQELQAVALAHIPGEYAQYFEQEKLFGEEVFQRFDSAREDIKDAGNSIAAELFTAAVFHLMRVAEYGLRALAKKLKVTLTDKGKPQPIEFADWNKVITGCRNAIADARKLPAAAKKEAQLQMYSRVADHCEYMKDIWRNEMAHTRNRYLPAEAIGVLERVRDFMTLLAIEVCPKSSRLKT